MNVKDPKKNWAEKLFILLFDILPLAIFVLALLIIGAAVIYSLVSG